MQRKRSTNNRTALTRAHLIVTAVGGPRILVEIPGSWHYRMVAATLHKLAAEIETDSEGHGWVVVCQRESDLRGSLMLELCKGDSEEHALDLLNRLAARYNTGKL